MPIDENTHVEIGSEAPQETIEEYKLYLYRAFSKELHRKIAMRVTGKVYIEPDAENDTLKCIITRDNYEYKYTVTNAYEYIHKDECRSLAALIFKAYKDSVWNRYFKKGRGYKPFVHENTESDSGGDVQTPTEE